MAKIILNNEEFNFSDYSRNIQFDNGVPKGSGQIGYLTGADVSERLIPFGNTTITSIIIKKDDNTIIYSLEDIEAKITSIDEVFNGFDEVYTNLIFQFN